MKDVNKEKMLFITLEHFILYILLSGSKVTAKRISSFPTPAPPRTNYISDLWNLNATGHCVDQKTK